MKEKNKNIVTCQACCKADIDLGMIRPEKIEVRIEELDVTDKSAVRITDRLVKKCSCGNVLERIFIRRKKT